MVTQLMGNTAAVAHAAAGDEILKNAFANQALEAYEIAAYKSLITMAMRQDDRKAIPLLKRSLAEEERMAKWVDDNVSKVTIAYLEREERGRRANR
jgi:ferritin-like metal-binding protein YciE